MIKLAELNQEYKKKMPEIIKGWKKMMHTGMFINGPNVKAFEKEFAAKNNSKYCVSTANGTDALNISMQALGIGPGDEVIVTSYSMFASASCIKQCGAKPVFIDINLNTFNMDTKKIRKAITKHTKAIVAVHLFGQSCNMINIMEIAKQNKLKVIEDCCQASGAKHDLKHVGNFGDLGCFSFFPTKNLGGPGDGGCITTNNKMLADRCTLLKKHGAGKKYIHYAVGINSRLDEVQAVPLRIFLKRLSKYNIARRKNASLYNTFLREIKNIKLPKKAKKNFHVWHQYTILANKRDKLKEFLKNNGVQTEVYYPLPLDIQPVWKGKCRSDCKNSLYATKHALSLPIHPELSSTDIKTICNLIKRFYEK